MAVFDLFYIRQEADAARLFVTTWVVHLIQN
jgi:hypothetical protein